MSTDRNVQEALVIEDHFDCPELNPPYVNYTPIPGIIPPQSGIDFSKSKNTGRCVVTASQPVIPVPLTQEIHHRETVIEVEQVEITDKLVPKIYTQDVYHEVPRIAASIHETTVDVPIIKIEETPTTVELPVDIRYRVEPTWKNRMVPRLFMKFSGKKPVIHIKIPEIEIIDKREECEVSIYVGEKYVEKEIIEEVGIQKVQYQYVLQEQEVPVYKYRPVFDVDVSIPPPVLVPVNVAPKEVNVGTSVIDWNEYKKQRKRDGITKAPSLDSVEPSAPPYVRS